jgi:signal transduction histidine kinase
VPPFVWQTWWFRTAAVALFTLSVIAVVRYVSFRLLQRRLRVAEQQTAVERERMRIARDIHDDLGDRLTTVAVLSDLALRNPSAQPGGDGERKRLAQISATARQATDALDEIVWAVNPRNDVLPNLINYVGQFAVEFLHQAGLQPTTKFTSFFGTTMAFFTDLPARNGFTFSLARAAASTAA